MEDDSKIGDLVKWGFGVVGLGAAGAVVTLPQKYKVLGMTLSIGTWVAILILFLFLALIGGYVSWRKYRAKRQSMAFSSAIEAQTAAAPRSISDPNQRGQLASLRENFQKGLQTYKSKGKDLYRFPWFVIIGESGSGKTEAIKHSSIEFPPGFQDEFLGTSGTINMDWWFTNSAIILDTAGSMIFPAAQSGPVPEWEEFLKLLKKSRPQCPINGLLLVLSTESLIKDSADTIAEKASKLARQLDLIQRTLDVRFPVYLLVTKADLLTGFREFFDNIVNPALQYQMFGWSNPGKLDDKFEPGLVEQHLTRVADALRRRRLALLLRESSSTGRLGDTTYFAASAQPLGGRASHPRLDDVDAMFALPDSVMRLAPRLRRYLETIFVAGPWSPKPVFLRGIYFTSSMREGKALDEAIALATGLSVDELPEDRSWEKNRAFFLRDLFVDKVFPEKGLVTRATNTIQLLRKRQFAIFGTAGAALLLLMMFAGLAFFKLRGSVGKEASYWKAGAAEASWKNGEWSPAIVSPDPLGGNRFHYGGTNQVSGTELNLVQFHRELRLVVENPLANKGVFAPLGVGGVDNRRREAQRVLFERSVIKPLVDQTRVKMLQETLTPDTADAHRQALLSLIQLETDQVSKVNNEGRLEKTNVTQKAERYLKSFLTYLVGTTTQPDTNLVAVFADTYASGDWPPPSIRGGDKLSNNGAISNGLENFWKVSQIVGIRISNEVDTVNQLVDQLEIYGDAETKWLQGANVACPLPESFAGVKPKLDMIWKSAVASTNSDPSALVSLAARYRALKHAATSASDDVFNNLINNTAELSGVDMTTGIIGEIRAQIAKYKRAAGEVVKSTYEARANTLDALYVTPPTNSLVPAYQLRWALYTDACALATEPAKPIIGDGWKQFGEVMSRAERFRTNLASYEGPLAGLVTNKCRGLTESAVLKLRNEFLTAYVTHATNELGKLVAQNDWSMDQVVHARRVFTGIESDLDASNKPDDPEKRLVGLETTVRGSKQKILEGIDNALRRQLGFPVLLNASNSLTEKDVIALKKFLEQMEVEFGNPAWAKLPENSKALDATKAKIAAYRSVVRSLIAEGKTGDAAAARFKISGVPHEMTGGSDYDFIKVYRWTVVKLGTREIGRKNMVDEPDKLAELGGGALSSEVTFQFQDYIDKPKLAPVTKMTGDWGLIRLIRDGSAQTTDGGKTWRIQVKTADSTANTKGVVFEVEVDPPLPKPDDWPK
jgi:hypothetical protein